ncbi:MAG: histidine phosphatase family protein [Clostridiales bacterium]|nr:histidine phosphatase family protein [Clostridiales bacterium]
MIEILLIRHSITQGNTEGRYIGSRTDEPLCEAGIRLVLEREYPKVSRIYTSPMKRCLETAELIWSDREAPVISVPELRECDFGAFENKNYRELSGDPDYQAWIDSGGTLPFPGGESQEGFRARCQAAFARIVSKIRAAALSAGIQTAAGANAAEQPFRAAVVAHGGTIMAILEKYGSPKREYFDYQVKNGCGYVLTPVEGTELWNYQYWQ